MYEAQEPKHKIHQILLYIPLDITKRALIARIYRIIQRYRIKLFFSLFFLHSAVACAFKPLFMVIRCSVSR